MNMKTKMFLSAAFASAMLLGATGISAYELTFAQCDAKRAAILAPAAKPAVPQTPEQKEYSKAVAQKLQGIDKDLLGAKKYAEAIAAYRAVIADQKAEPVRILHAMNSVIRAYFVQRDWEKIRDTAEEFLKDKRLSPTQKYDLLLEKARAEEQLKDYSAALATQFLRLQNCPIEKAIPSIKQSILSLMQKDGHLDEAIKYCQEMIKNAADAQEKTDALMTLTRLYRSEQNLEKTLATLDEVLAVAPDKSKAAALKVEIADALNNRRGWKKHDMAREFFVSVFMDKTLTQNVRSYAYFRYAHSSREQRSNSQDVVDKTFELLNDPTMEPRFLFGGAKIAADIAARPKGGRSNGLENVELAKQIMQKLLDTGKLPPAERVDASFFIASKLILENKFAEAERLTLSCIDVKLPVKIFARAVSSYVKVLSWQGKWRDASIYIRSVMNDANKQELYPILADLYMYFAMYDEAAAVWREAGKPVNEIAVYKDFNHEKAWELAKNVLKNKALSQEDRAQALVYFLMNEDPEAAAIRAQNKDLYPFLPYNQVTNSLLSASVGAGGNVKAMDELLNILSAHKGFYWTPDLAWSAMHVAASTGKLDRVLAMIGHKDIATDSTASKIPMPERTQLIFCTKMLQNVKNTPGSFKKFYDSYKFPANLTNKERSQLILKAAQIALCARWEIAAEEAHKTYLALFKPEPRKSYTVKFVNGRIMNMNGFLALGDGPEKQIYDRNYGGNMDFLTTDVSTGDRGGAISSAKDTKQDVYQPTVMQIACDEDGLHFLFTAKDSKVREIQAGLVSAGAYEMYLAPGIEQPHICLLPDMTTGLYGHKWNGTYDSPQWRDIVPGADRIDLKNEHKFTKDGYIHYMYLSWERFYDKLPEKGDKWAYENVHWCRFGGKSWNGTKSIHGKSTWGELVFDINDAQMAQIKRKIIYAARKAYLTEKRTTQNRHGIIDSMLNERKDPGFLEKFLNAYVEKLDSYLPMVTADMDDATVNKLYHEVVPLWFEVKFHVADAYRRYLEESMMEE